MRNHFTHMILMSSLMVPQMTVESFISSSFSSSSFTYATKSHVSMKSINKFESSIYSATRDDVEKESALDQSLNISPGDSDAYYERISQKYPTPASYERENFPCDTSVSFWKEYNMDNSMLERDFLEKIASISQKFVSRGGEALNYWMRHNIRTGYFFSNAVLGVMASRLSFVQNNVEEPDNGFTKVLAKPQVIVRLLAEAALTYDQDWENIANGKYKLPHDMYTLNQQQNPLFVAEQTGRYIQEAVGTLTRRTMARQQDKDIWLTAVQSDLYPDYYKTAFHYQTDGWMSSDSASVYETSTETLFLGRQDAMQRTALIPLVQYSKETSLSNNKDFNDNDSRPLKVLEVGCGTGRFLTFARDNLPLETKFTAVDLSPFYLEKARENDRQWISNQIQNTSLIGPIQVVQANAEKLPLDDESFDIAICMYMYHEIPREARKNVSSELARVVKKGGIVIFTDSVQLGDRPNQDKTLGNFQDMNEPFYRDYIKDFISLHFEKAGLVPNQKIMSSNTKTLVFDKP